jgi:hypothetical protein
MVATKHPTLSGIADRIYRRIVDLLMQLFWKQNKYAFNNSQYGHKQSESTEVSRDTSTPVRETSQFGGAKFIASNPSEISGMAPTSP